MQTRLSREPHRPPACASDISQIVGGSKAIDSPALVTLPLVGFSRWQLLRHFVPVCRESWRKLCKEGRAPQPIRLSQRCTAWSNEQMHVYLRDPVGYRAGQADGGATSHQAQGDAG